MGVLLFGLAVGLVIHLTVGQTISLKSLDFSLAEDSSISIDLSEAVPKRKSIQYAIEQLPTHGWLEGTLPVVVYHPKADYSGDDRFSYSVVENGNISRSANVQLTIVAENDPPETSDQGISLLEDTSVPLTLTATDVDGDLLSYSIVEQTTHGKISGDIPHLVYTPETNYSGPDRLVFVARDAESLSNPGTIRFTIKPRNAPPVANSISLKTYQNIPVTSDFSAVDPDNDALRFELATKPKFGTVKKKKERFVYYPRKKFTGRDLFRYRAFDGQDYSAVVEVVIDVQPFQGTGSLSQLLQRVVKQGGVAVGDRDSGIFIFQRGRYVPASILKLATALAATYYLGEDARFQTEFFQDADRNLYIKGYADPTLTTVEWRKIAAELSKIGIFEKPIQRIILDDTAIEKGVDFDGRRKTINYFDAPLGALASNHNIIAINKKSQNHIIPWKSRTPITAMIRRRARELPSGYQRFSVAMDSEKGTLYTGELIREIFLGFGAKNRSTVQLGSVPLSLDPSYIHDSSQDMEDVIRFMLHESSNFIANQLLLVMALDRHGEQARLSQGTRLLKRFLLKQIGLQKSDFVIVEGSGLSRKNRIDLKGMLDVVTRYENHRDLLPNLTKSKYFDLVEIGRRWPIKAKTGTMKGISTLAGFLQKKNKQWLPFVIMLEGNPADRAHVLEIICRYYAG